MSVCRKVTHCRICDTNVSHGYHFGIHTCRACAAFFRRACVENKKKVRCLKNPRLCVPEGGIWHCKKCRIDRCLRLGMNPNRIQLEGKMAKNISMIGSSYRRDKCITYVDLTSIYKKIKAIMNKGPICSSKYNSMNSLQKLAVGLREIRKKQLMYGLTEISILGKAEVHKQWRNQIERAAKFFMYLEEFSSIEESEKLQMFQFIWLYFAKMERIAMTAEMRVNQLCKSDQFIFNHDHIINYHKSRRDTSWISEYSEEQVINYIGTVETACDEDIVRLMCELQPNDIELSFMICNLCFQIAGRLFGGRIQEITGNIQDNLANNLHEHYLETDKSSRYSYRLTKILNINRLYTHIWVQRRERLEVAKVLNIFNIRLSHPELFGNCF